MDFNKIKTPLSCLVGSIFFMGIIYSTFFGVESIKVAIAISMVFIAVMPWKIIYFIFGSIILCLECMIFNKYEKISKLHLNIVSAVLLLFTIVCGISNYDAFDWKATLFGLLLYVLSRGVIEFQDIPKEQKENRYTALFFLFLMVAALITVLFADDKEFPHPEKPVKVESNLVIDNQKNNTKKVKELTALEKVAEKYKDEFKKLGFINIFKSDPRYTYSEYTYVISTFSLNKDEQLVSNSEAAKIISNEAAKQIDFRTLNLKFQNNKLIINGLEYDKKLISQEKVALALDSVMSKIVMPKLRVIEKEMKFQRDNLESYKK